MKKVFYNKLISPLLGFIKQGMSAEKVALTVALGLSLGIMPLMGFTTLLLSLLALRYRLNIVAIQLVHYSVSFLQIILFVPFLKLGQYIFNLPVLPFDMNNIITMLETNFLATFLSIWKINLVGVVVWLVIAIPLGITIYYFSLAYFIRKKQKFDLEVEMIKSPSSLSIR